MSVRFAMENFERYKERGLRAYREGDWRDARYSLLKAAEYLFKVAAESEGRLREVRKERAADLVKMAKGIDVNAPAIPPRRRAAAAEGKEDDGQSFQQAEKPDVDFDDIAGLDDVKEEIRIKVIYPVLHPDKADRYRIRKGGGILLYGPPGTGKTLMARAIAGEIDAAFFTVKPSEVMSKWVGEAEKNVEALFETARQHPLSIIFIDEIEALIPKRRSSRSSVMQRVVPQFLAELEGFHTQEENPILFVGATNEPWSLDPAVLRPGRFDDRIYVGLPDEPARRKILEIHLRGRPLGEDVDLDALARDLEGYSGADIRAICEKAAGDAFLEAVRGEESPPITGATLAEVMRELPPSVLPKDVKKFEAFGRSGPPEPSKGPASGAK
jgi:transitional endoplasmic reticulum ATPase